MRKLPSTGCMEYKRSGLWCQSRRRQSILLSSESGTVPTGPMSVARLLIDVAALRVTEWGALGGGGPTPGWNATPWCSSLPLSSCETDLLTRLPGFFPENMKFESGQALRDYCHSVKPGRVTPNQTEFIRLLCSFKNNIISHIPIFYVTKNKNSRNC